MRRLAFLGALLLAGCATARSTPPAPPPTPLQQKFVDEPGDGAVNFELGRRAELSGDYIRAHQYYVRAEELAKTDVERLKAAHRIVVTLVLASRYQEAETHCRRILGAAPGDRPTRYLLAAILAALDRPREAEAELETLRRLAPDDAQAYLELGKLYRDAYGDRMRADKMFRRYLALAPTGQEADAIRFEVEATPPQEAPAP